MTIVQTGRYNEILDKRGAQGVLCGMSSDFMKRCLKPFMKRAYTSKLK